MPIPADATLAERAQYLHRHLVLLRRVFRAASDENIVDAAASEGDESVALTAAVRDVIDDLAEHANVLTSVPFPIKEWRPGDRSDDERWRALAELERRDVLSMVSGYENLLAWAEANAAERPRPAARPEPRSGELADARWTREPVDPEEFLRAERARLAQFRQDMRFLDRRRVIAEEGDDMTEPRARRTAS